MAEIRVPNCLGRTLGWMRAGMSLSLHTFLEGSRAAGWDGTNLGQAAPAARNSHSSVRGWKGS